VSHFDVVFPVSYFANTHSCKVLNQSNQKLFETVLASIEKIKHDFFSAFDTKQRSIRKQTQLHCFEAY